MTRLILSLCTAVALAPATALAGDPTYRQGIDTFIETGVEAPDRTPAWYAPMAGRRYAPVFEILATRGTQGRYYSYTYPVTLKDIVRFHGHDCEGLVHAANAASVAFGILFPDGIIDRSVLWGITGESPCFTDTIAFLTGARLQYGNLGFFRDRRYGHAIVLYREDTGVAVLATWKRGIDNIPGESPMLPEAIAWKPRMDVAEMKRLKEVVKNAGGKPTPYQVDLMRHQQWVHVNDILDRPLAESYQARVVQNFRWAEWVDAEKSVPKPHARSDTRLKNYPFRERPIAPPK